jgi:hypothetical protein
MIAATSRNPIMQIRPGTLSRANLRQTTIDPIIEKVIDPFLPEVRDRIYTRNSNAFFMKPENVSAMISSYFHDPVNVGNINLHEFLKHSKDRWYGKKHRGRNYNLLCKSETGSRLFLKLYNAHLRSSEFNLYVLNMVPIGTVHPSSLETLMTGDVKNKTTFLGSSMSLRNESDGTNECANIIRLALDNNCHRPVHFYVTLDRIESLVEDMLRSTREPDFHPEITLEMGVNARKLIDATRNTFEALREYANRNIVTEKGEYVVENLAVANEQIQFGVHMSSYKNGRSPKVLMPAEDVLKAYENFLREQNLWPHEAWDDKMLPILEHDHVESILRNAARKEIEFAKSFGDDYPTKITSQI